MEQIEFLSRTDTRHLQTHIKFKIKEAFRERDEDVDRRRECLQNLLASEELQQEQEIANLFRERVLENMQKRLEWIKTAKFEKSEAEREFLQLKQIQRELENCEEMRPKESKRITEETKRVQLLQIAEKRALEMKEKEIDKIWFEASICLEKEREKQEQYENYLKKIIANKTVGVLNGQMEYLKYVKELENEEKKEENIQNVRARNEDVMDKDFERRKKLDEKIKEGIRQRNVLRSSEIERLHQAQERQFAEAKANELEAIQLQKEEEMLKMDKDLEKETYNRYLQYVKGNKFEMNYRDNLLNTAIDDHNRRTQPQPKSKTPYQKSVR